MSIRTRYHLAYVETLDAQCAAAVVKHHILAQEGENANILTYPLPSNFETSSGQYASLLTRIQSVVGESNGQQVIKLIPHDPSLERISVIGTVLPEEETQLIEAWGNVTYHVRPDWDTQSLCERAWHKLTPKAPISQCVQLIGRYTVHASDDAEIWHGEILPYIYACASLNMDPGEGWSEWEKLFESLASSLVRKRINEGKVIMRYLERQSRKETASGASMNHGSRGFTDDTDESIDHEAIPPAPVPEVTADDFEGLPAAVLAEDGGSKTEEGGDEDEQ
jgi:hypothetical protein